VPQRREVELLFRVLCFGRQHCEGILIAKGRQSFGEHFVDNFGETCMRGIQYDMNFRY